MAKKTMSLAADTNTFKLPGVGPQIAKHLARLQIHSPADLLFHLPLRYQDRTQVQAVRQLLPGSEAVVEGVIISLSKPESGRTKLLCELKDDTGVIQLRFFHILVFQMASLKIGTRIRCYSEVKFGPQGLEMVHPEFKVITPKKPIPVETHLTPFYPATEGLSQYTLRKLTANALAWMERESLFAELLPEKLLAAHSLPTLKEALAFIHKPPQTTALLDLHENKTQAHKRLVFEELLAHRLSLLHLKQIFQEQQSPALVDTHSLLPKFLQSLTYQLTGAQQRVMKEIQEDLQQSVPMLRLVQGDVGSGKTVIAALAMLQAVENKHQAALMVPTELLAEQHYRVFKNWLMPLGIQVVLLSSHLSARDKKSVLKKLGSGEAQIIIGTHALFQEDVHFFKLALVVVDEQHRFGVQQRALFREKGQYAHGFPHQLIMTATPIPRTLAMSFYADLDCSIIDELPPGRMKILTSVIANSRREQVIARLREACAEGRQAYWVCPLIDESEVLNCESATRMAEQLQLFLPALKIGLIHGRLSAQQKEDVMQAFINAEIQVLVATTVIEVGVDVKNASLMIIENAERLGLAQLHQLRGRVGRGNMASHCVLLYQEPLSNLAKERLIVMRDTTDGFKIAQRDLELRGPGEVLGTKQTGDFQFRVADLLRDGEMLPAIQEAAAVIMGEHQACIEALLSRWLGQARQYGKI